MAPAQFAGIVLDGHKGAAIEVPFDPAARWGIEARPLWPGRRGHRVDGRLNRTSFEGAIVPRSRTFFLLVDSEFLQNAKVAVAATVSVLVQPRIDLPDSTPPKK